MIYLLYFTVLLYSGQSLFLRLYNASRGGKGEMQFTVFYGMFAGLCTLAVNGFSYAPSAATVLLGLINAAVLVTYNISMSRAGGLGSYAFMMICVLSGGILVPMVYDVLYNKSSFSALQIVAVVLMLIAFVIMNIDGIREKKSGKYLVWCLILFFANGAYGVLMNLQQTIMDFTQRSEMIITTFIGSGLITAALGLVKAPKSLISGFRMSAKSAMLMLLSAVCATVAVNLFLYAMSGINLTVLNVVDNGGVLVVSALLAFLLFREKPEPRTLTGIVLSCASIVMLCL